MMERQLQHIYQAWQQGNEDYKKNWSYFVEYAARELNIPGDQVMQILMRCDWFAYDREVDN